MTNTNERRLAICAALAASAVPALVIARGHRIGKLEEVPLVLSKDVENVTKTKDAVKVLARHHADLDIARSEQSKKVRRGKGKMRNRRRVMKRGPLVIYKEDKGLTRAFRNIPGITLLNVQRLNLLKIAPGGHLGRFCIWTESAFKELDNIYGTFKHKSLTKNDFNLPQPKMTNSDLGRLLTADEIQRVLKSKTHDRKRRVLKRNPLKNQRALHKLNPFAHVHKRNALKTHLGIAKPTKKATAGAAKTAAPAKKAAETKKPAVKK
jgi:large subunit ribosomal protein L4e